MIKDVYTVKDVAEQLQVTEKTVRELISSGRLKAVKVCKKWIISAQNLKAFING